MPLGRRKPFGSKLETKKVVEHQIACIPPISTSVLFVTLLVMHLLSNVQVALGGEVTLTAYVLISLKEIEIDCGSEEVNSKVKTAMYHIVFNYDRLFNYRQSSLTNR